MALASSLSLGRVCSPPVTRLNFVILCSILRFSWFTDLSLGFTKLARNSLPTQVTCCSRSEHHSSAPVPLIHQHDHVGIYFKSIMLAFTSDHVSLLCNVELSSCHAVASFIPCRTTLMSFPWVILLHIYFFWITPCFSARDLWESCDCPEFTPDDDVT